MILDRSAYLAVLRTSTPLRLGTKVILLAVGAVIFLLAPIWSQSRGDAHRGMDDGAAIRRPNADMPLERPWIVTLAELERRLFVGQLGRRQPPPIDDRMRENWESYQSLTPEEKAWLKEKARHWRSLPPERRRVLHQKMRRWLEFTPEDRELFRQRFHQWRTLPPDERRRIREKLNDWEQLSPTEREEIRRRFRPH